MPTYGHILQELSDVLTKQAFIPAPNSSAAGQQQGGQPSPGGQGGQDPAAAMAQLAQQHAQLTGVGQGGRGAGAQGQPDPSQGQDPSAQGQQPGGQGQDPNAPPGGDLTPQGMPQSLKNTAVTVTVADLLDLVSGGKASQAHLKTESMKVQHGFKHKKMLRDEQRKEQEEQMKQQQEQAMQAQQQQGMMGGGIYSGGAMDGSQPGQGGGQAPAQPAQPQPGM